MSDEFEICVVGGGPAGASFATRIAELGHRVAIIEQHCFPRPHVGESLSPAIWPLLQTMGVRERVSTQGFTAVTEARVRWRHGDEERISVDDQLTVDRGALDWILLERAREVGVTVFDAARVRRPLHAGGRWRLAFGGRVLNTRFLADASGRCRVLGGRRIRTSAATLALDALWRGGPPPDGVQTYIEALADGWLWGARVPGGGFRTLAFVDPDSLINEGRDSGRLLGRLLDSSLTLAGLQKSARPTGPVRVCDATSYAASTPIEASAVKVGEAAFAIDPLSSCGVQTAIQTGLTAAAVVHTILAEEGDTDAALAFYTDHQRHSVTRHASIAARLYAEHEAHAGGAFWRRRSIAAPPEPAPGPGAVALRHLLPLRVRLRPPADLRVTPCLIGDRIELRRTLWHPALDRPVAFLGGVELAPLLDGLPSSSSLADAVNGWDRVVPPGRALEIATWLADRGLIEARPAGG